MAEVPAPEEKPVPIKIEDEMKQAYLDYAMSVIIGRALPDVRDGLKPVHRRTLFAMNEMGLLWNKPYKKSARLVGDVIGKYHPHGDAAAYDTIVRLVQDFSMRYPLVDGQGNFGSIDGDAAAAMRYTEIRMARIAHELLVDIDKETVDFGPNYDESQQEPLVLPSRIPNLLINGSSGIAVGMATNIPPHNLGEVVDGLTMLLNNPQSTVDDLMTVIKGPDFPTAAFINGRRGIGEAYRTGRGHLQLRARAFVEEQKGGRQTILVTELPYQVNKARLLEKIAELVRERRIEGISDLRDESDREGMRMVIELKRDADARVILNQLYTETQLQVTFGVIMLALVDNQPRVLKLKALLQYFLNHRREVVVRRTRFGLRKAQERAHILLGLKTAIENLDAVVSLIRASASPQEAKAGLIEKFSLDEVQAQAILEMRLQRLTGLERDKIVSEYEELLRLIVDLEGILASDKKVDEIIRQELAAVRADYADNRRTTIIDEEPEIAFEDLIVEEDMVVALTHTGYIKRSPLSLYRSQHRGGKGRKAMTTKEEDVVKKLFVASTHDHILFFTNIGKVHWLKVHELPQASPAARGKAIINLLQLVSGETVTTMLPVRNFEEQAYLLMATRRGIVKRTELNAYSNPRAGGIIAISLDPGDELIGVEKTDGKGAAFLGTRAGQAIRFSVEEVRPMGRVARGVIGIDLEEGDNVVDMEVVFPERAILTVTERGYGKRTSVEEYRLQGRGGKGIINVRVTEKNGPVVGIQQVLDSDEIMAITSEGQVIRLRVDEIPVIGRATQGVRLIEVGENDRVVGITRLDEARTDGNGKESGEEEPPETGEDVQS